MKKICILTTVHRALDHRIFYRQAKSLAQAGYSVTIIGQHARDEIIDGVNIIALPKPNNRLHRVFWLVFRVFYLALAQRAEVYHFHDLELLMVGVLLKGLFAKKVIYDIHEDEPKSILSKKYIPGALRKSAAFSIGFIQKLFSKHFDYVIAAGEDISDHFRETPVYKKIVILRNVPPVEFVKPLAISNESAVKRIVYAGGLSRGRGIKELVEAMNYVRNEVELFLIGWFDTEQFEAEIRGISNAKVKILGEIDYREVPDFLRTMSIGLICFHPEPNNIGALSGRNTKVYEYMSCGLAIIGSNFPLWKKIIEGENIGMTVNPKDPKEIASVIDLMLDRPDLLKKMRERALTAVYEKYNWEREKDKLLDIYRTFQRGVI